MGVVAHTAVGAHTAIVAHTPITSGAGASSAIKLSTDTTFDSVTLAPEVVAIFNGIGIYLEGKINTSVDTMNGVVDNAITYLEGKIDTSVATVTANVNTLKDTLAVVPRIVPKVCDEDDANASVISNWLGFFGSMNVPIVDTSLMPNIKTYITWASAYIQSAGADISYALSGIYATVTGYSFPAYAQSLLTAISEGISLRYTYDRYQTHAFSTTDGSACEHQFSIASRAIKRVWFTWQLSTYNARADLTAGSHTSNFFIHSSGDVNDNGITYIQLFLDSKPFSL